MNTLLASFKGVQIHVESASQKLDFRHQSFEFISEDAPTTEVYTRAPGEYAFEGFIIGRDALLTKDMLYSACADARPGALFHPLLGYKQAVCVSLKIEEISANAFGFALLCKEVNEPAKQTLVDQGLAFVDRAHEALTQAALLFTQELAVLTKTSYGLKRATGLLVKADSFLSSQNGLGIFAATLGNSLHAAIQAKELLLSPERTVKRLGQSVAALTDRSQLLQQLVTENVLARNLRLFAVLHNVIEDHIDQSTVCAAEELKEQISDPELFALLWDVSLKAVPQTKIAYHPSERRLPSLVASFQHFGDLDHCEELAYVAGQPFAL